jgi:hypothetical protein
LFQCPFYSGYSLCYLVPYFYSDLDLISRLFKFSSTIELCTFLELKPTKCSQLVKMISLWYFYPESEK